jgi:hypothetical protein
VAIPLYARWVPLLALAFLLLLPLAMIALMPLMLIQRYRAGTARRLARPWVATLNALAMIFSSLFFLFASAVTTAWVPNAFTSALAGIGAGGVLGVVGLWASRWESTPRALHYTPNRWLVLGITLVVTARVLYGFWRGWMAFQSAAEETSFIAAAGVGGSLAAGASVLGYYLVYSIGLLLRIGKWQKRALRPLKS